MAKRYMTANLYARSIFGAKTYKLALQAAVSCPNRDPETGAGGCIFCSAGGSGDFAAPYAENFDEQLAQATRILGKKGEHAKYIAYFQSYTGTYGDLHHLEQIYLRACRHPDIVGLSIATRPDCLGDEALAMLERLAGHKPLWVELGLQTMHERTAALIRRGYELSVYEEAMKNLSLLPVHRITHVILGLPGETREEILETIRYVGEWTDGIKLQLLHVLRGTVLAEMYEEGTFSVLGQEAYVQLLADAVALLPESVVVHRLTGDGAKRDLIAPLWSADKKRVLAAVNRELARRRIAPATEKEISSILY